MVGVWSVLPQILQFVAAAVSVVGAISQFWVTRKLPVGHRVWVALLAVAFTLTFWPHELSPCPPSLRYVWIAICVGIVGYVVHRAEEEIWERHGYYQWRPAGSGTEEVSEQILGSPTLTTDAQSLRIVNGWTVQRTFEYFDWDIKATFEDESRTRLFRLQRALAALSKLAFLIAFALLLSFLCLLVGGRSLHRPLTLTPSGEFTLPGGGEKLFDAKLQECDPTVTWDIQGSPSKKAAGALGAIKDGFYSAPDLVERDTELFIVATPQEHPSELQKVKILLKGHPSYSTPLPSPGKDAGGRIAEFQVEIINQKYAWVYKGYVLNGADGPALARRMNADGLFRSFDKIICIGAASREYVNLGWEQNRAETRARTLAGWVRGALVPRRIPVLALKIGRYNDEKGALTPAETEGERRVVLVGVRNADPNVDLKAALRDAFAKLSSKEPLLRSYLEHYPEQYWQFVE